MEDKKMDQRQILKNEIQINQKQIYCPQTQILTCFSDWVYDTHLSNILNEGYDPDTLYLIACTKDGEIKIFNSQQSQELSENINSQQIETEGLHRITNLNGKQFYVSTQKGYILRLMGEQLFDQKLIKMHSANVTGIYIDKQNNELYSTGIDQYTRVLDLSTEKQCQQYNLLESGGQVHGNGNNIFAISGLSSAIQVFDRRVKREIRKLVNGHNESVIKLEFINNKNYPQTNPSNFLFSGGHDNKCLLWDWVQGKVIKEFKGHQDTVFGIQYSELNDVVFTSSWDEKVRVYDFDTQKILHTFNDHSDKVISNTWNEENKILASSGRDNQVVVRKIDIQQHNEFE